MALQAGCLLISKSAVQTKWSFAAPASYEADHALSCPAARLLSYLYSTPITILQSAHSSPLAQNGHEHCPSVNGQGHAKEASCYSQMAKVLLHPEIAELDWGEQV